MELRPLTSPRGKATRMARGHCCAKVGPKVPLLEHCWAIVGTETIVGTRCTTMAQDQISAAVTWIHLARDRV